MCPVLGGAQMPLARQQTNSRLQVVRGTACGKRHAIGIATAVGVLSQQGVASAQSQKSSANYMTPRCREFVYSTNRDLFLQGVCAGSVETLIFFLDRSRFGICVPKEVTVGQAVRVAYIDQRPERMHESFRQLAIEALPQAWPCRR